MYTNVVGTDRSVGLATRYGLDVRRMESRWGEIICTCPGWPWGPPNLLYNGYRMFPGCKVAWASRAITLLRNRAFVFCSRAKFAFKQYKEREFWMFYTVRNQQEFIAVGRYLKSVMDIQTLNGTWLVTALWLVGDWRWWLWWYYSSLRFFIQYRTTVRTKSKILFYQSMCLMKWYRYIQPAIWSFSVANFSW
jgi:hypothetical protein